MKDSPSSPHAAGLNGASPPTPTSPVTSPAPADEQSAFPILTEEFATKDPLGFLESLRGNRAADVLDPTARGSLIAAAVYSMHLGLVREQVARLNSVANGVRPEAHDATHLRQDAVDDYMRVQAEHKAMIDVLVDETRRQQAAVVELQDRLAERDATITALKRTLAERDEQATAATAAAVKETETVLGLKIAELERQNTAAHQRRAEAEAARTAAVQRAASVEEELEAALERIREQRHRFRRHRHVTAKLHRAVAAGTAALTAGGGQDARRMSYFVDLTPEHQRRSSGMAQGVQGVLRRASAVNALRRSSGSSIGDGGLSRTPSAGDLFAALQRYTLAGSSGISGSVAGEVQAAEALSEDDDEDEDTRDLTKVFFGPAHGDNEVRLTEAAAKVSAMRGQRGREAASAAAAKGGGAEQSGARTVERASAGGAVLAPLPTGKLSVVLVEADGVDLRTLASVYGGSVVLPVRRLVRKLVLQLADEHGGFVAADCDGVGAVTYSLVRDLGTESTTASSGAVAVDAVFSVRNPKRRMSVAELMMASTSGVPLSAPPRGGTRYSPSCVGGDASDAVIGVGGFGLPEVANYLPDAVGRRRGGGLREGLMPPAAVAAVAAAPTVMASTAAVDTLEAATAVAPRGDAASSAGGASPGASAPSPAGLGSDSQLPHGLGSPGALGGSRSAVGAPPDGAADSPPGSMAASVDATTLRTRCREPAGDPALIADAVGAPPLSLGYNISFASADEAVAFCAALQRELVSDAVTWPAELANLRATAFRRSPAAPIEDGVGTYVWKGLRLKTVVHTGDADAAIRVEDGNVIYTGPAVEYAQRVLAVAPRGVVLVTDAARRALTFPLDDVDELSVVPCFGEVSSGERRKGAGGGGRQLTFGEDRKAATKTPSSNENVSSADAVGAAATGAPPRRPRGVLSTAVSTGASLSNLLPSTGPPGRPAPLSVTSSAVSAAAALAAPNAFQALGSSISAESVHLVVPSDLHERLYELPRSLRAPPPPPLSVLVDAEGNDVVAKSNDDDGDRDDATSAASPAAGDDAATPSPRLVGRGKGAARGVAALGTELRSSIPEASSVVGTAVSGSKRGGPSMQAPRSSPLVPPPASGFGPLSPSDMSAPALTPVDSQPAISAEVSVMRRELVSFDSEVFECDLLPASFFASERRFVDQKGRVRNPPEGFAKAWLDSLPVGQTTIVCVKLADEERLEPFAVSPCRSAFMRCVIDAQRLNTFLGFLIYASESRAVVLFQRAEQAVRYALDVQAALLEVPWAPAVLNAKHASAVYWADKIIFKGARAAIGIHTGRCGVEMDSFTRRPRLAVGNDELLAATLSASAKGGEIVVTAPVVEAFLSTFDICGSPVIRGLGAARAPSALRMLMGGHVVHSQQAAVSLFQLVPFSLMSRLFVWRGFRDSPKVRISGVFRRFVEELHQELATHRAAVDAALEKERQATLQFAQTHGIDLPKEGASAADAVAVTTNANGEGGGAGADEVVDPAASELMPSAVVDACSSPGQAAFRTLHAAMLKKGGLGGLIALENAMMFTLDADASLIEQKVSADRRKRRATARAAASAMLSEQAAKAKRRQSVSRRLSQAAAKAMEAKGKRFSLFENAGSRRASKGHSVVDVPTSGSSDDDAVVEVDEGAIARAEKAHSLLRPFGRVTFAVTISDIIALCSAAYKVALMDGGGGSGGGGNAYSVSSPPLGASSSSVHNTFSGANLAVAASEPPQPNAGFVKYLAVATRHFSDIHGKQARDLAAAGNRNSAAATAVAAAAAPALMMKRSGARTPPVMLPGSSSDASVAVVKALVDAVGEAEAKLLFAHRALASVHRACRTFSESLALLALHASEADNGAAHSVAFLSAYDGLPKAGKGLCEDDVATAVVRQFVVDRGWLTGPPTVSTAPAPPPLQSPVVYSRAEAEIEVLERSMLTESHDGNLQAPLDRLAWSCVAHLVMSMRKVSSVVAVMRHRARAGGGGGHERRLSVDPSSVAARVSARSRGGTVRARSRRSSLEAETPLAASSLAPPSSIAFDGVAASSAPTPRARAARERGVSARRTLHRPKAVDTSPAGDGGGGPSTPRAKDSAAALRPSGGAGRGGRRSSIAPPSMDRAARDASPSMLSEVSHAEGVSGTSFDGTASGALSRLTSQSTSSIVPARGAKPGIRSRRGSFSPPPRTDGAAAVASSAGGGGAATVSSSALAVGGGVPTDPQLPALVSSPRSSAVAGSP